MAADADMARTAQAITPAQGKALRISTYLRKWCALDRLPATLHGVGRPVPPIPRPSATRSRTSSTAEREAERSRIDNVRWRHLRAEALPAGIGRCDAATLAQSFHWMDRGVVAAALRRMLSPHGALVLVQATTHRGDQSTDPLARPRPPHEQIAELVREYLGPVRRAGQGRLSRGTPSGEGEILRAAGFAGHRRVELDTSAIVTRSEDDIVAATFSLSSAAPHLFGARVSEFEADLRRVLRQTSPDGTFAERTRDVALDIWHPA
jgi:hypothetical protein